MTDIDKAVLLFRAAASTLLLDSTSLTFLTMTSPTMSCDIDLEAQPVVLQLRRATY